MKYNFFLFLLISFNSFSNNYLNNDFYADNINVERSEGVLSVCLEYAGNEKMACFKPRLFFDPEQTEVYSIVKQELIVYGACCGREKDKSIDYYKYISRINDWVLYKAISSDYIGPKHKVENNFLYFDDSATKINYFSGNTTIGGEALSINYIDIDSEIDKTLQNLKKKYHLWLSSYKDKKPFLIDAGLIQIFEWLNLLSLSSNTVEMYNNIGYFLFKKGKYIEAIYLLEKVVDKFPDRMVAQLNLADALYDFGQVKQAIPFYSAYYKRMKAANKVKKIPAYVGYRLNE